MKIAEEEMEAKRAIMAWSNKNTIVMGFEPTTSRPVILRSTVDLHDPSAD